MDKVDTQSPHTFKSTDQRVTRRGFLGLSVKGVAALTVGGLGLGGIEEFIRNNPTIIDQALITLAVDSGEFTANRIGPIKNLSDIANKKTKELSNNPNIHASHILIADRDTNEVQDITNGQVKPDFPVTSLAKVPVCIRAWEKGQITGKEYLTDDLAMSILKYSSNEKFIKLVDNLSHDQNDTPEITVRKILSEIGIEPKNTQGKLPLRIDIHDFLTYMRKKQDLPEITKKAMKLVRKSAYENFGVNKVVTNILNKKDNPPAMYFKIGLIDTEITEDSTEQDFFCSYYARCDGVDIVGYSRGNIYDTYKEMLSTLAMVSIYIVGKN